MATISIDLFHYFYYNTNLNTQSVYTNAKGVYQTRGELTPQPKVS